MILKQKGCNTASCREVRKDIGWFIDELKQPDNIHLQKAKLENLKSDFRISILILKRSMKI